VWFGRDCVDGRLSLLNHALETGPSSNHSQLGYYSAICDPLSWFRLSFISPFSSSASYQKPREISLCQYDSRLVNLIISLYSVLRQASISGPLFHGIFNQLRSTNNLQHWNQHLPHNFIPSNFKLLFSRQHDPILKKKEHYLLDLFQTHVLL